MVDVGRELRATGLDVASLTDLRRRLPPLRPVLASCHVLMMFTAGRGRHGIDFVDYECRPSTLLWARPGQVHQFAPLPTLDATVLLFSNDLLPPPSGALSVQLAFRVSPGDVDRCDAELRDAGIEPVSPPRNQPWGHRTLFFRDPDGNVLEIYAEI